MIHSQKKFGRRRMKWMIAITRSAIAHQEKAKKRNDPIAKSHYSTRPRQVVRGGPKTAILLTYFLITGLGAGAVAGAALKLSITDFGSLSASASSRLTCHISVVESALSKPGIPVMRIPPETFQYVSPAGSSVTPLPSISFGGFGNMPFAIAVCGCPGSP